MTLTARSLPLLTLASFCLFTLGFAALPVSAAENPSAPVPEEPVEELFSEAELDQMLAPVALFPDALLAQILTAATYPLEVVEAARWTREHPKLEGNDAVEAVEERPWDPSVKALVAFPDVLRRMDEDLVWTRRLGDAVLVQEDQVMAAVQRLREKAQASGALDSLENVEVRREEKIIYIEPADPRVVYVPYYRPSVVYGTWWWPSYPPVWWRPSTVVVYTNRGIAWSHGIHFSYTHFFTCFDWRRSHLVIIRHHTHDHFRHRGPWIRDQRDHFDHRKPDGDRRSRGDWVENREDFRWRHNPEHRRGVQYRHRDVRERFGGSLASIRMRTPERAAAVRYAPNPVHDRIRDRDRNGGRIRERIESKPLPSGIRSPRQDLRDRQHQAGSDERSRTVHEREREREIRRSPVERVRERNAERQVEAARLRQRLEKTREASPLPGGEREAVTRRRTETHNEWSQVRQRTRETPEMRRQEVREVPAAGGTERMRKPSAMREFKNETTVRQRREQRQETRVNPPAQVSRRSPEPAATPRATRTRRPSEGGRERERAAPVSGRSRPDAAVAKPSGSVGLRAPAPGRRQGRDRSR